MAADYSPVREQIQRVKSEILDLEWSIKGGSEEERAGLQKFFRNPDPDYGCFPSFLDAVIEEVLVFDALAVKVGRSAPRNRMAYLSLLAGHLVRPYLDVNGFVPVPPETAFRTYLQPVPRVDVITTVQRSDLSTELRNQALANYTSKEVLYLPRYPRRWTAFGFPPTEKLINVDLDALSEEDFVALFDAPSLAVWLKEALFDRLLHDAFGHPEMEWVWSDPPPLPDPED